MLLGQPLVEGYLSRRERLDVGAHVGAGAFRVPIFERSSDVQENNLQGSREWTVAVVSNLDAMAMEHQANPAFELEQNFVARTAALHISIVALGDRLQLADQPAQIELDGSEILALQETIEGGSASLDALAELSSVQSLLALPARSELIALILQGRNRWFVEALVEEILASDAMKGQGVSAAFRGSRIGGKPARKPAV